MEMTPEKNDFDSNKNITPKVEIMDETNHKDPYEEQKTFHRLKRMDRGFY